MNISFDLDNTLIPNGNEFETEKQSFLIRLFRVEKIRKGTCELFDYLQKQGHTINIYTTSYRSKAKIRFMFLLYGLKVTKIINQTENVKTLKNLEINASKYPLAYNFDLHIDDSIGVKRESEQLKFNTIVVKPNERNWVEVIKRKTLKKYENRKNQ